MVSAMQFISFPVEIILSILGALDEIDLVNCTAVAKKLRKIIIESSKLQYAVELAKRRMISLRLASVAEPYASRLRVLRDREIAWDTLTWKGQHRLKLPPSGSMYEFVGGVYAMGKENDAGRLTGLISFMELPTSAKDAPELRSWTHLTEDIKIVDFTMDPSQDLLVLIVLADTCSPHLYELHLRSLTTNEPHPLATLPKLACLSKPSPPSATSNSIASVRIQITGHLVALLVKEVHESVTAHLEIWDWIDNPQISCKLSRMSGIEDFTFLSDEAFLLVRPAGSLEVYTFPNPITDNTAPISRYNYAFPQLSAGYMYWYMNISTNPAPLASPRPGNAGKQLYSDYCPNPKDRIQVCTICVFDPAADDVQRVHCFIFFVNASSLLHPPDEWIQAAKRAGDERRVRERAANQPPPSIILAQAQSTPHLAASPSTTTTNASASASLPADSTTSTSDLSAPSLSLAVAPQTPSQAWPQPTRAPLQIPWSIWGPKSTRWFEECINNSDWEHSVYGLRTIDSVRPRDWFSLPPSPNIESQGTAATAAAQGADVVLDIVEDDERIEPRYLRIRDYNPYIVWRTMKKEEESESEEDRWGLSSRCWGAPRLVTASMTTEVKGVFTHDVESSLPYVEVLSKELFEVTDVMMDDRRLLLLQRGEDGMLKNIDVLTM